MYNDTWSFIFSGHGLHWETESEGNWWIKLSNECNCNNTKKVGLRYEPTIEYKTYQMKNGKYNSFKKGFSSNLSAPFESNITKIKHLKHYLSKFKNLLKYSTCAPSEHCQ